MSKRGGRRPDRQRPVEREVVGGDSLERFYNTPLTDLKHKHAPVLVFEYVPDGGNAVRCRYLRWWIVAEPDTKYGEWVADIRLVGTKQPVKIGKRWLRARGKSWAMAVTRLMGLPMFFHNQSHRWLDWYEVYKKPHIVHPSDRSNPRPAKPADWWLFIGEDIPVNRVLSPAAPANEQRRKSASNDEIASHRHNEWAQKFAVGIALAETFRDGALPPIHRPAKPKAAPVAKPKAAPSPAKRESITKQVMCEKLRVVDNSKPIGIDMSTISEDEYHQREQRSRREPRPIMYNHTPTGERAARKIP